MYRRRIIAFLLCLLILLSVSACGGKTGGYRYTSVGLDERTLSVGCREGDPLLDVLYAAVKVRVADGTAAQLSQKWFGKNLIDMEGNADALVGMDIQEGRTLLVGYEPSSMPFAGTDGAEKPQGFEIELARSVCDLLGWELRALPIRSTEIAIELLSGEVDCVWGGIEQESAAGVNSFGYMQTEYVLVTMQQSHIKNVKTLKDKAVSYPQFAQNAADALELTEKAGTAAKLLDTEACFTALKAGRCDAVLTDDVSAAYYTNIQ